MKGEKGERRKQDLLRTAYQLFVEKGYDNTSVDEIISAAGIAKGTYYYYFPSKQATLEAVIDMMISEAAVRAGSAVFAPIPVPQKIAAVIMSLRPDIEANGITEAINRSDNIVMHEKINRRIIDEILPLLTQVVNEGLQQGIFDCDNIEQRVRMLLIMSQTLFDRGESDKSEVEVFIDMTEKTLGAQKGTMGFIRELIA